MKKLFTILTVLIIAVSCLDGGSFSQSYTPIVTFEYNDTEFKDSLCYDTEYKIGLGWDYLAFFHKIDEATLEFKGGFLVSCLSIPESEITEGLSNNEYRVNMTVPQSAPNKFAVLALTDDMPEKHMAFMFDSSGDVNGTCTMTSVFVNNTVAAAEAMAETFEDGDACILTATGYLEGAKTDAAEIKLAEFTSAKDSIVSSWTAFDLSKLGSVDKVVFDIAIPEGKDIPKTVCMDNLMASISLTSK